MQTIADRNPAFRFVAESRRLDDYVIDTRLERLLQFGFEGFVRILTLVHLTNDLHGGRLQFAVRVSECNGAVFICLVIKSKTTNTTIFNVPHMLQSNRHAQTTKLAATSGKEDYATFYTTVYGKNIERLIQSHTIYITRKHHSAGTNTGQHSLNRTERFVGARNR